MSGSISFRNLLFYISLFLMKIENLPSNDSCEIEHVLFNKLYFSKTNNNNNNNIAFNWTVYSSSGFITKHIRKNVVLLILKCVPIWNTTSSSVRRFSAIASLSNFINTLLTLYIPASQSDTVDECCH